MSSLAQSRPALVRVRALALGLPLPLTALFAGVALLLGFTVAHLHDWFVMTDELLYERLAVNAATTLSPLPAIHGQAVGNLNQLYPLLIAPLFGHGDVPFAITATHVLNAIVMASAALPAYALGRNVLGSSRWALAAAALAVVGPWMVLSSFLLTEVVAYPTFIWAVWGMERTLERPSRRADLVALVLIGVATSARVQLVVLLPALVAVAAVHELRFRAGGRLEALRRHDLLFAVAGFLALAALVLAAAGRLASAFGTYAVTAHGSIVPLASFPLALRHLAVLALGCGIVPLVAGLGWALVSIVRPQGRREHGYALLATVLVLGMAVQVGAFAERFGDGIVRDRYLFYVVPLLGVAMLAYLRARPRPLLAPVIGGAVFVVGIALQGHTFKYAGLFADSPASVTFLWFWRTVDVLGGGLRTCFFVAALGVLLVFALCFGEVFAPRLVAHVAIAFVIVASLTTTVIAFDRLFTRTGTAGRPTWVKQARIFAWIDGQVPKGSVSMLPFPTAPGDFWTGASVWWDAEFWNEGIGRSLALGPSFSWTPTGTFPLTRLHVNQRTGEIAETPSDYLLDSPADTRMQVVGDRLGYDRGLQLLAVTKPWRAAWLSRGLSYDGYVRPGIPAELRVFAGLAATTRVQRQLVLKAAAPSEAVQPIHFTFAGQEHSLEPGEITEVGTQVCVPAQGFARIPISSPTKTEVSKGVPLNPSFFAEPRIIALRLTDITLGEPSGPC